MTKGILDVDGLKASLVLLPVLNDSNTSSIPSTRHHDNITNIKFDEVSDLVGLQIQLDGVVSLYEGIRVSDSSSIICVDVWNPFLPKLYRTDLAQLELKEGNRYTS